MPVFRSLLCLCFAASLAGAQTTIEFTVSAGKIDRKNEPVRVPLQLSKEKSLSSDSQVDVKDDKGQTVAQGQLTFPDLFTEAIPATKDHTRLDLVFILPSLKAGQTASLKAVISKSQPDATKGFNARPDDGTGFDIRIGDRNVMRYFHKKLDESTPKQREETFKVFHHVYDPEGKFLVTKGVGGQFTHHRGLFYGFMKTTYGKNTVDIWHCRGATHQADANNAKSSMGRVLFAQRRTIDWNGAGKKTFAKEQRELTTYNIPGGTMIDFESKLTPLGDEMKLDGDPQHAGFHFRASNEVAERQAAYQKAMKIKDPQKRADEVKKLEKDLTIFIRPNGDGKPGTETNWPGNKKHVNLPWLAMSFVVKGKRFTACYLDLPTNPKEARFSERAYGRFGSYFVTTVKKEKPLVVRYRIWLQEGKMKGEEVAALSKAFAEPVTVKVK